MPQSYRARCAKWRQVNLPWISRLPGHYDSAFWFPVLAVMVRVLTIFKLGQKVRRASILSAFAGKGGELVQPRQAAFDPILARWAQFLWRVETADRQVDMILAMLVAG